MGADLTSACAAAYSALPTKNVPKLVALVQSVGASIIVVGHGVVVRCPGEDGSFSLLEHLDIFTT
jgi:hypothetical protein